jgi:hypothetical protein
MGYNCCSSMPTEIEKLLLLFVIGCIATIHFTLICLSRRSLFFAAALMAILEKTGEF